MTIALAAVAGSLVCASAHAGPEARVIRVAEFGAVGDGVTDDGPAVQRAIEAAATGGPATLEFESRTYRVGPREDHWCRFVLTGAADVVIDGHGAELILTPTNCAFLLDRCERVTLRDLRIDYDPLPFTQGDVVELDPGTGSFVIRVHDGYPMPDAAVTDLRQGAFIDPEVPHYTGHWLYVGKAEPIPGEERLCRITAKAGDEGRVAGAALGQRFVFGFSRMTEEMRQSRFVMGQQPENQGVFLSNPAGTIQLMRCRDCTLESIDTYSSIGMTYRLTGSDGITLRHLRVVRKPGTDRLVASLSDGIHCKNSRAGPLIEDCVFEALLDDSINLSTMSDDIQERIGDRTFLTWYSDIVWYDTPIEAGDTVLVFDPVSARVLGESRVTGVQFVGNRQRRVTLDSVPEGVVEAKAAGPERATRLWVKQTGGAVVRGCWFRSQMKTAMVFRVPGLCEDNLVEDCFFGVHSHNSPTWGEGPLPGDLTIRGNEFRHIRYGAIVALCIGQVGVAPAGGPIRIEGNTFFQRDGHGVHLTNLTGVRIAGNTFLMQAETPQDYVAVEVVNGNDTEITGCRIIDSRLPPDAAIRMDAASANGCRAHENAITQRRTPRAG